MTGQLDVDVDLVLQDPTAAFRNVLHAVAGWDRWCAENVQVERISGAMSNLVFHCQSASARENDMVIVRVFGRGGKLFSHQHERNIFTRASKLGLGPKCLVEFPSARVEEFLPGANLTSASMREPAIAAAIARAMAAFHVQMLAAAAAEASAAAAPAAAAALPAAAEGQQQQQQEQEHSLQQNGVAAEGGGDAVGGLSNDASAPAPALAPAAEQRGAGAIWGRIRSWHGVAMELAAGEVEELGLTNVLEELSRLEACFASRFPTWLGFCHNDLQYGNMLLFDAPPPVQQAQQGQQAQQAQSVRLIDYEYSTLNDVAFDVANHWVEYTYDYHSDTPHALDWARFPSPDQQRAFCEAYVGALWQLLEEHRRQQAQQLEGPQQAVTDAGARQRAPRAAEDSAYCNGTGVAHMPNGDSSGSNRGSSGCSGAAGSSGAQRAEHGGAACPAGLALAEAILGTEGAVELLQEKALAYATLCHLKWSLWGLIQAKVSDVDFDYLEYSRQRVVRYHKAKTAFL